MSVTFQKNYFKFTDINTTSTHPETKIKPL